MFNGSFSLAGNGDGQLWWDARVPAGRLVAGRQPGGERPQHLHGGGQHQHQLRQRHCPARLTPAGIDAHPALPLSTSTPILTTSLPIMLFPCYFSSVHFVQLLLVVFTFPANFLPSFYISCRLLAIFLQSSWLIVIFQCFQLITCSLIPLLFLSCLLLFNITWYETLKTNYKICSGKKRNKQKKFTN